MQNFLIAPNKQHIDNNMTFRKKKTLTKVIKREIKYKDITIPPKPQFYPNEIKNFAVRSMNKNFSITDREDFLIKTNLGLVTLKKYFPSVFKNTDELVGLGDISHIDRTNHKKKMTKSPH